ncbi:uncharacterized protein LOC134020644 [Osmerus eperlanus]|uniref:uncharacterized protein LOC134020644 n=1 Tax=Osmerus eperlanus TaxID=29151 RepID=UPI002E0F73C6
MDLQEAQVSAVLPSLVDMREQHLLALRKEHEWDLRNPRLNCLLTLLTSEAPPIPSSLLPPDPCPEPSPPIPAQNNVTDTIPEQRAMDGNQVATDGRRERQDTCTGCGETFEDLPYLEILCIPPTVDSSNTHQASSHTSTEGESAHGLESAHGGVKVGQEGSPTKTPQIFEKQDSLITLAWSKPPEAAATDVSAAAMEQDSFCSVQGVSPCDTPGHSVGDTNPPEETGCGARQLEVLDSSLFQSSSKAGPGPRQTEGHTVNIGQRESATGGGDQALRTPLETGEAGCDVDLYTHTPVTHTETTGAVEVARTHSVPEEKAGMSSVPMEEESNDDILAAASSEFAYLGAVGGQPAEQEVCHPATEPWAQSGLDQSAVDQTESSVPESARMQESMLERERTREPVSVMERERTMRSLVDMQKKVEHKQQRDRERQLLRVQERLSIIHNRKSEEDLLGLKQKDRLRHLTHNLPQEDKSQQKTVVRERLEQVRRERSYVMQSKRDRNTAGFKELLAPVVLQGAETEEGAD